MTADSFMTQRIGHHHKPSATYGRLLAPSIALLAGLGLAMSARSVAGEFETRFEADGRDTSLDARFVVAADADCVLQTLFEFEHLEACASGFATVVLVDESESEQTVDFVYEQRLFSARLRYRRVLVRERAVIEIDLISSEIGGLLAPRAERSVGTYEVRATREGTEVRYEERTTFARSWLNFVYAAIARRQADAFLTAVRDHLHETCPRTDGQLARAVGGNPA